MEDGRVRIARLPRFRGTRYCWQARPLLGQMRHRVSRSRCPSGCDRNPARRRSPLAMTTSGLPLERSHEALEFPVNELLDPLAELRGADVGHHAREARVARSPADPGQMLTALGEGHADAFEGVDHGLHGVHPVAVQEFGAVGRADLERCTPIPSRPSWLPEPDLHRSPRAAHPKAASGDDGTQACHRLRLLWHSGGLLGSRSRCGDGGGHALPALQLAEAHLSREATSP